MIKSDLEEALEQGPIAVSNALKVWRTKTHEKKRLESTISAEARLNNPEITTAVLRDLVRMNKWYDEACTEEIIAEAEYKRVDEKHLSNKRLAAMRAGY